MRLDDWLEPCNHEPLCGGCRRLGQRAKEGFRVIDRSPKLINIVNECKYWGHSFPRQARGDPRKDWRDHGAQLSHSPALCRWPCSLAKLFQEGSRVNTRSRELINRIDELQDGDHVLFPLKAHCFDFRLERWLELLDAERPRVVLERFLGLFLRSRRSALEHPRATGHDAAGVHPSLFALYPARLKGCLDHLLHAP